MDRMNPKLQGMIEFLGLWGIISYDYIEVFSRRNSETSSVQDENRQ